MATFLELKNAANCELSIEKRALKAYRGNYYLFLNQRFIIEPETPILFNPKSIKFDSVKLTFEAAANEAIVKNLATIKQRFYELIAKLAPEKIKAKGFDADVTKEYLNFTISDPTIQIKLENGDNAIINKTAINTHIPAKTPVKFIALIGAIYDIDKESISFFYKATAIKILGRASQISADLNAL